VAELTAAPGALLGQGPKEQAEKEQGKQAFSLWIECVSWRLNSRRCPADTSVVLAGSGQSLNHPVSFLVDRLHTFR
jgi:hypothetical protein